MAKSSKSGISKGWIIGGAIALLALILIMWVVGAYNGLITSRENVRTEFANLDASYQRRLDLIPNLVQTVAGFAEQERTVLTDVTDARSRVGTVQLNVGDLGDADKLAAYQAAQAQVGGALSRLIAVAENYPQLRSSENFLALQNELEGTENRINIARRDYNAAAREYNVRTQRLPTAMIAGLFNFDQVEYFEAQEGATQAPAVTKDQFQ